MILSLFAIIKLSAGIAILHNGCSVHAGTHDNNFGSLYLCKVFLNDGLVYLAKVSLKMAKVSLKPENFSYLPLEQRKEETRGGKKKEETDQQQ